MCRTSQVVLTITWMSIIIHSAQSVYIGLLVLGVVLGLA